MKKSLLTGLIILLPLALTLLVVAFIFNLLTDPFVGFVKNALNYFGLFRGGFLFMSPDGTQQAVSKLLILAFLFVFTLLLGILARWVFIRYLLKIWDFILHRIPFVSTIYRVSQDVINTIFSKDTNSFKQVVMIHFPHQNSYSIGFITRNNLPPLKELNGPPLVAVFVPTTPNPTSGFLIAVEAKDLIYVDITVEDALKYILSCGTIANNFPLTFSSSKLNDPS